MHLCPLCLGSGPDDHVFVYFTDHGAPGILAFPNDDVSASVLPAAASVSLAHSLPLITISESKVMSFNELASSFQTCIYSNVAEHFETPVNYFDNETRKSEIQAKISPSFPYHATAFLMQQFEVTSLRELLMTRHKNWRIGCCFLWLLIINLFVINVCLTLTW